MLENCKGCRVLGMTSQVLTQKCTPPKLDLFLDMIEKTSKCNIDTASEIVSVLR